MIPSNTNKMKDVNGKWRTYSLFYEHRQPSYDYYWCLADKDRQIVSPEGKITKVPSLKQLYLSYSHIPKHEYEFAEEVIGSWIHWDRLANKSGLKGVIAEWREELEIKLKANAMRALIKASVSNEGPSSLQAAKYLADKGYAPTRGRPSKAEKAGLARQEASMNSEIEDDLERVGLTAVKN